MQLKEMEFENNKNNRKNNIPSFGTIELEMT